MIFCYFSYILIAFIDNILYFCLKIETTFIIYFK